MKRYTWSPVGNVFAEKDNGEWVTYADHEAECDRRVREARTEMLKTQDEILADERESVLQEVEAWKNNTKDRRELRHVLQAIRSRGDSGRPPLEPLPKPNPEEMGRQDTLILLNAFNNLANHVRALEEKVK